MDDDKLFKFIGPLSFKVADKFFKFVSWIILIVAIRYVYSITKSEPVRYLDFISTTVFGMALTIQAMYIAIRHPSTLGVPEGFIGLSRFIQFFVGLFILGILSSPYLFTDQILDAIFQARLK